MATLDELASVATSQLKPELVPQHAPDESRGDHPRERDDPPVSERPPGDQHRLTFKKRSETDREISPMLDETLDMSARGKESQQHESTAWGRERALATGPLMPKLPRLAALRGERRETREAQPDALS